MVTWPARLDTEHRDLPTEVVPIYRLAFLDAFKLLAWQELEQVLGAPSIMWVRSCDGWSSDLAAQGLLQFNLQQRHIPSFTKQPFKYSYYLFFWQNSWFLEPS